MTTQDTSGTAAPASGTRVPGSERIAVVTALVGVGVVVLSTLPGAVAEPRAILPMAAFMAWALVPYTVLYGIGRRATSPWAVIGAGAFGAALEIGIRLSVFVFPRGSTAAIALVFSPLMVLLVAMPVGALAGWVVGRAIASGRRVFAAAAMLGSAAALGLIVLGTARPDLFPSVVYARNRALERIGPPGIRIGRETFESVSLGARSAWYLTGEFDGQPGDEVAVISKGAADIFDTHTLTVRSSRTLAGESARWNWFSQLAWTGGELVRVDVGGGFQDTQVLALDGQRKFLYRPDERLPPNALRAADLDGDGDAEFYASTQTWLARLDHTGREVWKQQALAPELVALQPATPLGPPWLVTRVYGQALTVWSPQGVRLTTVPERDPSYRPVVGILEWRGRRLVGYGGDRLTLRSVDGDTVFEHTVADMRITGAWVVAFDPSEPSRLVVQATADRDTRRARLQMLDAAGALLYDEVTDVMPQILTARGRDGTTTLFLGRDELRSLRPRLTQASSTTVPTPASPTP